jgi:hypothetical protein
MRLLVSSIVGYPHKEMHLQKHTPTSNYAIPNYAISYLCSFCCYYHCCCCYYYYNHHYHHHYHAPDNIQHSQETDIHACGGFEPAIPASEQPQTHILDRAATGIGNYTVIFLLIYLKQAIPISGVKFNFILLLT